MRYFIWEGVIFEAAGLNPPKPLKDYIWKDFIFRDLTRSYWMVLE